MINNVYKRLRVNALYNIIKKRFENRKLSLNVSDNSSQDEIEIREKLHQLKLYADIFQVIEDNKEIKKSKINFKKMDLDSLIRFISIRESLLELIDYGKFSNEEPKLVEMIKNNESIDKNDYTTDLLYYEYDFSEDDIIFQNLLLNKVCLIMNLLEKDPSIKSYELIKSLLINLKTVDLSSSLSNKFYMNEDYFTLFKSMIKEIISDNRYQFLDTTAGLDFLTSVKLLKIDLRDSLMYGHFYVHMFRDITSDQWVKNSKIKLLDGSNIKGVYFQILSIIKFCNTYEIKDSAILRNTFDIIYKILILCGSEEFNNAQILMHFKYSDLFYILRYFEESQFDSQILSGIFTLINKKIKINTCSLENLTSYANYFINKEISSEFAVHFIAICAYDKLTKSVTAKQLETEVLLCYEYILKCSLINTDIAKLDSVNYFTNEIKSIIFFNKFTKIRNSYSKDSDLNLYFFTNLKRIIETYRQSYLYDEGFLNYIKKAILLNTKLNTIH